jgi:hypothetical protein
VIVLQATTRPRWQGIVDDGAHIGYVVNVSLDTEGRGTWEVRDLGGGFVSSGDRGAIHEADRAAAQLRQRTVAVVGE